MASRASRQLTWESGPARLKGLEGLVTKASTGVQEASNPTTIIPWVVREHAVFLLHIAAEIEHALMAQYLYAAFSLGGDQVPPERREQVNEWRRVIVEIAREEMGHLATVENLLQLIGGPLTFDREDFPVTSPFYPFPFTLEPLTKRSLAKYVLAEAPDEKFMSEELKIEMRAIQAEALLDHGVHVNRVGVLYQDMIQLFTQKADGPPAIDSADIQAESVRFQASASEWGLGYSSVLILQATDRAGAIDALKKVAEQGEGASGPQARAVAGGDLTASHFARFLAIYRQFPADKASFRPSRPMATNPSMFGPQDSPSLITNPDAQPWALLANVRYRMVLNLLTHAFLAEAPVGNGERSSRGLLISWSFGEMYNLRSISDVLSTLPLRAGGSTDLVAGLPFEMPYTVALPSREIDRWRVHRDNIQTARVLIEEARKVTTDARRLTYLDGLIQMDQTALEIIAPIIGT